MKHKLKRITRDFYNICSRIRKIDRFYEIFFDPVKQIYVVYRKHEFCFVAGKNLDKRAIDKARNTHVRRAREIFFDIEDTNKSLQEKAERELLLRARQELKSDLDYIDKTSKTIKSKNITRWL